MVAQIREEGLHRSQLVYTVSYIADVLGARLTNSLDMKRAQRWAVEELERIGMTNITVEPFMDYGASWDNLYTSIHLLEPDYQPMVGYPLAFTPGTDGREELDVVIANVETGEQADALSGTLAGKAVLSTPPYVIDPERFRLGTPRRTDDELQNAASDVIPPSNRVDEYLSIQQPRTPRNPEILTSVQRLQFFRDEGVAVVLESRSGWPGAVRGFGRPGARADNWSRDSTLASLPTVAITPEHYNRMYRIALRGIPVKIEVDIRNRIGEVPTQAANVIGEIPGSDKADEIVMLGAHLDTWHASPNASDNTSGVAVALEAVRILTELNVAPRRTIRLALWSGEEQGLFGSRAYVEKHFGDPNNPDVGLKPGYETFSVYFNQDYGPGLYRGIWLQENEYVRNLFTAWMEPLRDLGMTTTSIQSVGSTDHVPFDNAGLPAFQFLQDRVGGTGGHTNLDFFDTLPIDDLTKNAVIMASFVYHAAMMEERMPRKVH